MKVTRLLFFHPACHKHIKHRCHPMTSCCNDPTTASPRMHVDPCVIKDEISDWLYRMSIKCRTPQWGWMTLVLMTRGPPTRLIRSRSAYWRPRPYHNTPAGACWQVGWCLVWSVMKQEAIWLQQDVIMSFRRILVLQFILVWSDTPCLMCGWGGGAVSISHTH